MGGFQKYPIPRFMNIGHWVVNRNWKMNVVHLGVPLFFTVFMIWRNAMLTTVNKKLHNSFNFNLSYLLIKQYRNIPFGEYLDPASEEAPKRIKL